MMIDILNSYFNTNKLFIGLTMIIINLGSKYIVQDMTDMHTKILSHKVFKQFILVCIFFTATRDILLSIILSCVFSIFVYGLLDENRPFNLWHSSFLPNKNESRIQKYKNIFNGSLVKHTPLTRT
jgi:hypothetical protein